MNLPSWPSVAVAVGWCDIWHGATHPAVRGARLLNVVCLVSLETSGSQNSGRS